MITFLDFDPRFKRAMSMLEEGKVPFGLGCGMGICSILVEWTRYEDARRLISRDPEIEPMFRGEDLVPPGWPPPPPGNRQHR